MSIENKKYRYFKSEHSGLLVKQDPENMAFITVHPKTKVVVFNRLGSTDWSKSEFYTEAEQISFDSAIREVWNDINILATPAGSSTKDY